jgi:hypothetical protein
MSSIIGMHNQGEPSRSATTFLGWCLTTGCSIWFYQMPSSFITPPRSPATCLQALTPRADSVRDWNFASRRSYLPSSLPHECFTGTFSHHRVDRGIPFRGCLTADFDTLLTWVWRSGTIYIESPGSVLPVKLPCGHSSPETVGNPTSISSVSQVLFQNLAEVHTT